MFFLEYEDCYLNLRKAIYKLKNKCLNIHNLNKTEKKNFEKNQKDIYCYFNGEIINIEINNEGIFIIIDFSSLTEKKINFSKRMINSSLVVITNNSFSDYLLSVVSYNPYIEKKLVEKNGESGRKYKLDMLQIPKEPRYRIKFEVINLSNESFGFMLANKNNLQLFESKSYFQTYIHILNRLQNLVIKQLPFEEEIVKVNFDNLEIDNPDNIFIYNDNLINPKNNIFPDSFINNLDESQLEAIKHCLTSKLALIQGPPWTGKTHVGTIVTNIFKQNLKKDSKILVVCFTNHALDQFLENILKYNVNEDDIVRIGGRCKNENIKKLVLNNSERYKNWKFREIENKIRQLGNEMEDMIKLVQNTKESIIEEIKKEYPEIYKKIIDDFFNVLQLKKEDYIPKYQLPKYIYEKYQNYRGDKNQILNKIKQEIIGDEIFKYWSNIGNSNFHFIDLFTFIFENMNLNNKNEIYKSTSDFKNCAYDDNKLLDKLKFFNKPKKENKEENEDLNDNNNNEESEEEGSYIDNEDEFYDRVYDAYDDDILRDENDIFKNYILNIDNDFSLDTNNIELTEEKINFLINNEENINLFKIGHTLIKLIINYVKKKLLNKIFHKTGKTEFQNFRDIIKKKHELNILYDAQIIKQKQIVAMTTIGCNYITTIYKHN